MPIYAFQCTQCEHEFERLQRLSDPDPETCPACSKPGVRRQLSAPAFRLAGTGWYETDFKGAGEKKRNLVDSPASADSGSTKASSADTGSSGSGAS